LILSQETAVQENGNSKNYIKKLIKKQMRFFGALTETGQKQRIFACRY
jgi:hypothetical protein